MSFIRIGNLSVTGASRKVQCTGSYLQAVKFGVSIQFYFSPLIDCEENN